MVKPYLSIKLKDPQHYYLEDETINCAIDLRLEKILKDAVLRVSFKGRSSSHSSGTRHHFENIFTTEKEISITKWNTANNVKKMNEIEFTVEVPNGVTIPSYRNLEGSDGGKIEYMVEAILETAGLFKRSVQASHIISIPLIGKVNINENGLQRSRESSIRWPKHEESVNSCVLSAWIPHEGCIRGKDVPIRVEIKQPDRCDPVKSVLIELVRQEIIASSKDSYPDMTKQLDDKIIHKEENEVKLYLDGGASRLLVLSQVFVINIPSNTTPTISENAKVMRLDYKIRVIIKIPGLDSGKDKVLSVNLPIVVGTTGVSANYDNNAYDSGFDLQLNNQFAGNGGSEGNNSVINGYGGNGPAGPPSFYSGGTINHGYNYGPPPPISPLGGIGGFHMPEPNNGFPQPMYPPGNPNRFVLNPQQLAYTTQDNDSNKFEGMPMPDFSNPYPSHSSSQSKADVSLSSSPGSISNLDRNQSLIYPPPSNLGYPPPIQQTHDSNNIRIHNTSTALTPLYSLQQTQHNDTGRPLSTTYPPSEDLKDPVSSLTSELNKMCIPPPMQKQTDGSSSLSPSSSISRSQDALNNFLQTVSKPNTPTPPRTPAANISLLDQNRVPKPSESSTSYHSSTVYNDDPNHDVLSANNNRKSTTTRIDPLNLLVLNSSSNTQQTKNNNNTAATATAAAP